MRPIFPAAALAAVVLPVMAACAFGRSPQNQAPASSTDLKSTDSKTVSDNEFAARQQPAGLGKGTRGDGVPNFWVRSGLRVEKVATLPNARFMEFDDKGRLVVSRPDKGDIVLLTRQNDGTYGAPKTLVSNLPSVHGLHFANGLLWFTQSDSVRTLRIAADGTAQDVKAVLENLPHGGHFWRSIFVTKDGFYTSIGDSGNITDQTDTDRQKIWFYSLDGKTRRLIVSGIRNTEKLRFRPGTRELYGMDHGSDWFGKNVGDKNGAQPVTDFYPPDEFNRYVEGGFYGHPFIVGDRIPRYEFSDRPDINDLAARTIAPIWKFGAHWAANGFAFLDGASFGSDWQGDAICAMHGSWNDSRKVGYRIERVMFDSETGLPYGSQMLVGTLDGQRPLARPVDVVQEPGGALLWSDDQGGVVYRLRKA